MRLINFRRTVATAGALVVAMLVAAWAVHAQSPTGAPKPAAQNSAPQGRFQIVFSPFVRADTFLLDTETGHVWQPVSYTSLEGDPKVWEAMPVISNDGDRRAWVQTQSSKSR